MSFVTPEEGLADILGLLLAQNLQLHLFKNNWTPGDTDTLATFTEATFAGYAAITLTGGLWTITQAVPTNATYPAQTFNCTTSGVSQTIYGYYVSRPSSGKCWWAERFPPANIIAVANAGQSIIINPKFPAYHT